MKWNCYRIGDVFSRFSSGKNITESRISDNDSFPVYGGNGVRGFTDSYNFEGECILIGRQGAKCGNVRYFKGKAYMSDHAIVGVSKSEHCARFLHVALSCLQLNRLSGQAAQPGLSVNMLKRQKLLLPTLSTQEKISTILSAYDDLIENNNKRIKILEQMAVNLYKEWFVRFRFPGYEQAEFENGIPKGWEIKKIKDCIKRLPYNRLYKASELKSEGKVIVIDQSTAEYLGFHDNEPSHSASYDLPIILFGDHSCKFKLMCSNFSLGENVIPFTVLHQEKDNTYFLYYAVHKLITTEEYKRHWNRLVNMKILKPSQCLQNKFAEFIIFMQKQKQSLFIQNQNLTRQRDLLLPRLMSGKLEV